MTWSLISELFVVSLVALLLALGVLMVLCWVLRRIRSSHVIELKIWTERPARKLTIRTQSDNARQLLDQLLDRVFLQVEPRMESGGTLGQEPGAEPGEELGGESSSHPGSDPEVSTAASLPSRAVNALQDRLRRWLTVTSSPAETPPPPDSPINQDQMDDVDPEQLDAAQYVSMYSSSGSDCREEERHEESKL